MRNREKFSDISARIKQVRKDNGLNQTALAELVGVSRSYLSEVESGKIKVNVNILVGVAKHLPDVDMRWVLLGESSPMPQQAENDQQRYRLGGITVKIELIDERLNEQ